MPTDSCPAWVFTSPQITLKVQSFNAAQTPVRSARRHGSLGLKPHVICADKCQRLDVSSPACRATQSKITGPPLALVPGQQEMRSDSGFLAQLHHLLGCTEEEHVSMSSRSSSNTLKEQGYSDQERLKQKRIRTRHEKRKKTCT